MGRFLVRRLAWMAATLVGVSMITFLVVFLIPANPAEMIAGDHASPQVIATIEREYGLDRPLYVQYGMYVWHAVHGDFGTSYVTDRPVLQDIFDRFPATAELAVCALVGQLAVAIPIGILAAMRQNEWPDTTVTVLSLIGNSLPGFWVGVMLLYTFAFKLPLFPLGGYGHGTHLAHVFLPAVTLMVVGAAGHARLLRASMIEVKNEDYVRTARAKGAGDRLVLWRHIVRNALLPVVTVSGLELAGLLSGLIIIESVFGWPGIGQLTFQAISNLDIPMIMGTTLFSATLIVTANLCVDMLYAVLDPRITIS